MDQRKILIQIDSDPQASVFDRIVAVDSGAEEVFSYGGVMPEQIRDLVHGAIFTRGPKDLSKTAFFIGGSDVRAGERLLEEVLRHMVPRFGLRVSVLFDANGANTTAAAAVIMAGRHLSLQGCSALVLGATGPVGQRAARLLAREGARVAVGSRQLSRAQDVCSAVREKIPSAALEPVATASEGQTKAAVQGRALIIAAGAAGSLLLPKSSWQPEKAPKVAIDLNAVLPLGIEGVEVTDKAAERGGVLCYGAIGVGSMKMKIHKAAIARLFERNDQILDAEEVYALAKNLA
jgi:hypothetical protein